MKTIKFFAALTIMLGFAMGAIAQQSDNDNIDAKAEVVAQVVVTAEEALQFGMVTPDVTKTISVAGAVLAGTAGTSTYAGAEQAGQFSITKGANTWVTVKLSLPTTLTRVGQSETLPINFTDSGANKLGLMQISGANDFAFTPTHNADIELTLGDHAAYFASTGFDLFIGGTVVPANNQVAGNYLGEITLTATYN